MTNQSGASEIALSPEADRYIQLIDEYRKALQGYREKIAGFHEFGWSSTSTCPTASSGPVGTYPSAIGQKENLDEYVRRFLEGLDQYLPYLDGCKDTIRNHFNQIRTHDQPN
jgi:hypothetical protein